MSVFFDPTVQREYLVISPTNSNLELTGNFTIEFFLKSNTPQQYPTVLTGNYPYLSPPNNLIIFASIPGNPNKIVFNLFGSAFLGNKVVIDNLWHHVALVRNGSGSNNIKLYVDGIMDIQLTSNNTINFNINGLLIAGNNPGTSEPNTKFQGYLSNLRIVNGTAVYTSNFTPPTTTLTNIPGTALLLFTDPNDLFVDGSSNNYTVTKFTSPNFPTASVETPVTIILPCFKEDSKILCFIDGIEKEILVQDLKPGVLVKTLLNGYVPVDMIGNSKMFNPGNNERFTNRLYLLPQDKYPELNEDLVVTGGHSILVDEFEGDQREKTLEKFKEIYITDDKYRLIAEFDDRAAPYNVEGEFNIYHFALENDNYYYNYGVYANGLLVETCSKRYLTELSNMKIL